MKNTPPLLSEIRKKYHKNILRNVLRYHGSKNAWNNVDTSSAESVRIAGEIVKNISKNTGEKAGTRALSVQAVGRAFEEATLSFIKESFLTLSHLRPGKWNFSTGGGIYKFEQYAHIKDLQDILKNNAKLRAAFGDYIVRPDIVVSRAPESDNSINKERRLVDSGPNTASKTPLRESNSTLPIMHASVSCKWTIRSDRAQNVRTEGLNLVRNRKGNTPHIAVVTGEPLPARINPLAFGTGDIDCVYHFALAELEEAAGKNNDSLNILIESRRLRDISDLPFDLAV